MKPWLPLLGAVAVLAGCASPPPPAPPAFPKSYVVLLPNADGSVGQVTVKGDKGEQRLTQANQAAGADGSAAPRPVDASQLKQDFGDAMQARPAKPEQFLLYFERGGTELTAESRALLPRILELARTRAAVDMSVIGHTDTQGAADVNERLALQRANAIAQMLRQQGLSLAALVVESHGERNLLVPTPDNVEEPRNRRVEITLR